MINNRQNGRRRGRGGQRPGGGNPGRPDNGSRIDNRARGNASQLHEKYKALAADAQRQGDRVNTEYYLQFADHYFRVLSENRPRVDEQQRARRDEFDDDFGNEGDEFGQEGEPVRADQYQPQQQDRPRYEDRPRRDDRPRQDERPRQDYGQRTDERPRGDDRQRPDNRQRDDYQRDDRPRQDARPPRDDNGQGRDERRPRYANGQQNGAQANNNGYARPEPAPEPVEVAVLPPEPVTDAPSTVRSAETEAPPPRRRGRPRRERPEDAAAGVEGAGLEADRLPPSLSVSASAEPDTGEPVPVNAEQPVASEVEKPRRRRRVAAPADAPPVG